MLRSKKTPSIRAAAWPLWFRALGSVWCAAFLIALLAVILIASTTLESALGTPRAQRLVYQTFWFDAFLGLFAVNIAFSTVLRWPFKKKHTGFIITHIGILLLLGGAWATRLLGAEGQMALFEGEHTERLAATDLEIRVAGPDDEVLSYPLASLRRGQAFAALPDGTALVFSDFEENAAFDTVVEETAGAPNPAIRVKLSSALAGFSDSFWLIANDADGSSRSLGPATLELKTGAPPPASEASDAPKLVFHRGGRALAEIPLVPPPSSPVDVGSTGYKLRNVRYLPDARVENNNKLVSVSDAPNNPAVEAELVAPSGDIVRLVRFTLFPDFESMHGTGQTARPDFDVTLSAGAMPKTGGRSTLSFYAAKPWQFRFQSMKGGSSGSVIEEGKTYPAGWMDFEFRVERLVERASVHRDMRPVNGKSGRPAADVRLVRGGREIGGGWMTTETPLTGADGKPLAVVLRQRMIEVPFRLFLRDFRKVDYPGTARAASFESDVTLDDPAENLSISRTIKMNKPLDYKGWRIFQSSYMDDAEHGEGSVFTVAKNPGIPAIYGGAVILFAGVFVTFFIPALSSLTAYRQEPR